MLSTGWSTAKVALFQLVSGATAFVGLYLGIGLAQNFTEAQSWMFIIAAGMFLYVALVDVVCIITSCIMRKYYINHSRIGKPYVLKASVMQ